MRTRISANILKIVHERGYVLLQDIHRALGMTMTQVYELSRNIPHLSIDLRGNIIPPEQFGKGQGFLVIHLSDLVIGFPGHTPESLAETFKIPYVEKSEDPFVDSVLDPRDILHHLEKIDYTRLAIASARVTESGVTTVTLPAPTTPPPTLAVQSPSPNRTYKNTDEDVILFKLAQKMLSEFIRRHNITIRFFQNRLWPKSKTHLSNIYHLSRGDFRSRMTRDVLLMVLRDPKTEALFSKTDVEETSTEETSEVETETSSEVSEETIEVRLVFEGGVIRVIDPHRKLCLPGIELSGEMSLHLGVSLKVEAAADDDDLFLQVIPAGI